MEEEILMRTLLENPPQEQEQDQKEDGEEEELLEDSPQETLKLKKEKDVNRFDRPVEEMDEEEVKAYASINGWYDKEGGKDARTFAKEFEDNAKFAVGKNKDLAKKVEALEKSMSSYVEMTNKRLAQERAENEKKLSQIGAKKKQAEEDYDLDAYKQAEAEEKEVKEKMSESPLLHPDVTRWGSENDWINTDKDLSSYFEYLANQEIANPSREFLALPEYGRLEYIKEKVMKAMPHKFSNPNQIEAPSISPASRASTATKRREPELTIENMPKEYKNEYNIIYKAINPKDREEFSKNFLANVKFELSQKK